MVKFSLGGKIGPNEWVNFITKMGKLAPKLKFPINIPDHDIFCNTGIILSEKTHPVRLFDFETLFSPGIILSKKRQAIIVPIQRQYADMLLGKTSAQMELGLFTEKEALVCLERAYFRSAKGVKNFHKGMIVIFYVSGAGGGDKSLLGWGRITSNQLMHVDDVKIHLSRQGVLSDSDLLGFSDEKGELHAFTFDNFTRFTKVLKFGDLRRLGFVSPANLVTAETLTHRQLLELCELVF